MASIEIKVPDLGNVDGIDVIEVLVQPGDVVEVEQTLAVLETDKATMDLPSSSAGKVEQVHIKVGDQVSEGTLIVTLSANEGTAVAETAKTETTPEPEPAEPATPTAEPEPVAEATPAPKAPQPVPTQTNTDGFVPHASPSVRLFARELGVDLSKISQASGRKGRILKDDVTKFVKQVMQSGGTASGSGIPAMPSIDFSQYGEIEELPLKKIKRLTGQNMSRVWLNLPMVTYHDEVDITELETFRKATNADKNCEIKLTPLVFIIKALVSAMKQYPSFNSSLSPEGDKLYLKKYCHIGIAVDTPNGLVVPVLRDADKKSINELSQELVKKSELARQGKLMPADMQGGSMTISSLGGIGGMAFTPIVNAPEVAILGVTRSSMKPVWNGTEFEPRLMLPLDLTYDHRVIDGAEGARFMEAVKSYLGDIRRLLL
jgi:pyruvate dehydrogenase E2 component (dihydrolipoyllysine-residue acetyltransferase)